MDNESSTNSMDWDLLLADCIDFTQQLIQTPSMSHQESEIANLIAAELYRLAFDEVAIDGIGNVIGRIHGQDRKLPALVLNTHLDHVDPGDPSLWAVPPYSGTIVDGHIIGRGACDIKGPLAVQVYAMAALRRSGRRPRRDVVFTGVVQEEIGGAGAQYWVENLDYPVALVVIIVEQIISERICNLVQMPVFIRPGRRSVILVIQCPAGPSMLAIAA